MFVVVIAYPAIPLSASVAFTVIVLFAFVQLVLLAVALLIVGPVLSNLNVPYAVGLIVFPAWSFKFCTCTCK